MRRGLIVGLMLAVALPAQAQFIVSDPLNTIQNTITAGEAVKELVKILELLQTMQRLSANAGDMQRYKTPAIVGVSHDIAAHPFAAATLTGLNSGDPVGVLYMQNTHVLDPRVVGAVAAMPPDARRQMETDLSTVDMKDSVNERTIQLMANSRGYGTSTANALQQLETSVLTGRNGERYLTAVMEKLAGLGLADGRQRSVNIQVLSTILEQLLAKAKPQRDMDVLTMNQRINALTADPNVTGWVQKGAGTDLFARDVLH